MRWQIFCLTSGCPGAMSSMRSWRRLCHSDRVDMPGRPTPECLLNSAAVSQYTCITAISQMGRLAMNPGSCRLHTHQISFGISTPLICTSTLDLIECGALASTHRICSPLGLHNNLIPQQEPVGPGRMQPTWAVRQMTAPCPSRESSSVAQCSSALSASTSAILQGI